MDSAKRQILLAVFSTALGQIHLPISQARLPFRCIKRRNEDRMEKRSRRVHASCQSCQHSPRLEPLKRPNPVAGALGPGAVLRAEVTDRMTRSATTSWGLQQTSEVQCSLHTRFPSKVQSSNRTPWPTAQQVACVCT